MHFEVGGRATLGISGSAELQRIAAARMDPLHAMTDGDGAADVVVRPAEPGELGALVDVQRAAGDGVITGSDGERLHLISGDSRCAFPDPLGERPAAFAYEPGFPIAGPSWRIVRTALQLSLLRTDAVAVHASCVELDGGAVLIAGWSETGKTETALALAEAGGRFVSDKWTVLTPDGAATAFPIEVGIRSWVLPHLPRLRSSLPRAARFQLGLAGRAAAPAARLRERARGPRTAPLAEALERGVSLAERVPVAPSTIRAVYGRAGDAERAVPLRAVVLLTTADGEVGAPLPADAGWAARRLARSAAYERRPYFALTERARFALPQHSREDLAPDVADREERLLKPLLTGTSTVQLRSPFPTDPGPVAQALMGCL